MLFFIASKMPNNTWFTSYSLSSFICLNAGPSQGIVYKLDKKTVIKVPFQYSVNDIFFKAYDYVLLSLQSFMLFKKESHFYNILTQKTHSHITQSFQCGQRQATFLKHLDPVKEVWSSVTRDIYLKWIQQLLSTLSWIKELGYVHDDITIHNISID